METAELGCGNEQVVVAIVVEIGGYPGGCGFFVGSFQSDARGGNLLRLHQRRLFLFGKAVGAEGEPVAQHHADLRF